MNWFFWPNRLEIPPKNPFETFIFEFNSDLVECWTFPLLFRSIKQRLLYLCISTKEENWAFAICVPFACIIIHHRQKKMWMPRLTEHCSEGISSSSSSLWAQSSNETFSKCIKNEEEEMAKLKEEKEGKKEVHTSKMFKHNKSLIIKFTRDTKTINNHQQKRVILYVFAFGMNFSCVWCDGGTLRSFWFCTPISISPVHRVDAVVIRFFSQYYSTHTHTHTNTGIAWLRLERWSEKNTSLTNSHALKLQSNAQS